MYSQVWSCAQLFFCTPGGWRFPSLTGGHPVVSCKHFPSDATSACAVWCSRQQLAVAILSVVAPRMCRPVFVWCRVMSVCAFCYPFYRMYVRLFFNDWSLFSIRFHRYLAYHLELRTRTLGCHVAFLQHDRYHRQIPSLTQLHRTDEQSEVYGFRDQAREFQTCDRCGVRAQMLAALSLVVEI